MNAKPQDHETGAKAKLSGAVEADHYATLGVAHGASAAEVKQAYRKLARRFHPDVSRADTEAQFKAVAQAHEVLIDAERRSAYDAQLQQQEKKASKANRGFEFAADSELGELLRKARGNTGWRAASREPLLRGEDLHAEAEIPLVDSYSGASRRLNLQLPRLDDQGRRHLQDCPVDLQIPPGLRSGQRLRLAGLGGPGLGGGAAGDLYITVQLRAEPPFRLDSASSPAGKSSDPAGSGDVFVSLALAPWEAALGAAVQLRTPGGSRLELQVQAGACAGQKLRLKGRGLPAHLNLPAGDLYAELELRLPLAESPAARAAYEQLAAACADFQPRG